MAPGKSILLALTISCWSQLSYAISGTTTRYWDCCKPSCGWPRNGLSRPVTICDAADNPLADQNTPNYCDQRGTAFSCSNQTPWAVDDSLSYGFAAVKPAGETEETWCCSCYQLKFTSGPVTGKTMIVQATNTGVDLRVDQFDIAMPGGGQGIYPGCTAQYPETDWGGQTGGINSREQCDQLPEKLKAGCYWRFDWFMAANNPDIDYTKITCPAELSARTGCTRA